MSSDLLREAAALMRERAEKVPEQTPVDADVMGVWLNSRYYLTTPPAVALAVADWLDSEDTHQFGPTEHAINVACAYLGREVS